jgi:chromosome segregation ATPase
VLRSLILVQFLTYSHHSNEHKDAKERFKNIELAATKAAAVLKRAKNQMYATLAKCKEIAPLVDEDDEPLPLKAKLEALPVENMEEAQAALEDAEAKANSIDDNPDVLLQYEKLKGEIVEIKDELENLSDTKDAKLQEIRRLQEPWENALENSLSKVNNLFAVYMSELGCAGQIVLRKGDASAGGTQPSQAEENVFHFDQWGVEIQVKFREKAKMSVLSAQRHSGGERSVSTIMYLMALQELMVSPFRCVDEINQGLDERNERLVFKRIVRNSTQPPKRDSLANHSGQYFLITPKLLPNLVDMEEEAVTVHVITNGAYTFENPLDWNPDKFVEIGERRQAAGVAVVDENSPEVANVGGESESSTTKKKKRRVS